MIRSHARERLPGESFEGYKVRRSWSNRTLAEMVAQRPETTRPRLRGVRRPPRDMGQHPKFKPERRRRPSVGHGPTWPHTDDQREQSRPLLVAHPLRHLKQALKEAPRAYAEAMACANAPKWVLDAWAAKLVTTP